MDAAFFDIDYGGEWNHQTMQVGALGNLDFYQKRAKSDTTFQEIDCVR